MFPLLVEMPSTDKYFTFSTSIFTHLKHPARLTRMPISGLLISLFEKHIEMHKLLEMQ